MTDKEETEWVAVSTQLDEWVALIHRDHLQSEGIDSVILNKKDSSYNLNFGKGGYVYVMVRTELKDRAEKILTDAKFSLNEDSLPMSSDPNTDSEIETDKGNNPDDPQKDSDLT